MTKQLLTIILCWLSSFSFAQKSILWGNLKPGKHIVGFKVIQTYDLSRPFLPKQQEGILSGVPEGWKHKGRQVQISLWYPAQKVNSAKPIFFEHYIHLLSQIHQATGVDNKAKKLGWKMFLKNTKMLGGKQNSLKRLAKLGKINTQAYLNAPPKDEKHPLVLFPAGHPTAEISIMAEYLASKGYVVAGIPNLGITSTAPEISTVGLQAMAQDVLFTLGHLSGFQNVDRKKVAIIGNAFSSSIAATALLTNADIDALISLEGGLLSDFEQRMLKQQLNYEVASFDRPILAIYAPHPAIDPQKIAHLKYATRYFVHFPTMKEFHFLNYGSLEQQTPQIIGKTPKNVQQGYEWGCRYVYHFLNATLKKDSKSQQFLRNPPKTPKNLFQTHTQTALPAPPTIAQLKHLFTTQGMTGVEQTYQHLRHKDSSPFSLKYFDELFKWLGWSSRDNQWVFRDKLANMVLDSHPKSALSHYFKASVANAQKNTSIAKKHFKQALKCLDSDLSNYLSVGRRVRLRKYSQQALNTLTKSKKQN
ncbi:MAG TPA: hypothetical protein DCS93_31010 [Microscillaceae bacterium]|nr:hypothetical protein [Microscillaceae bacterium]